MFHFRHKQPWLWLLTETCVRFQQILVWDRGWATFAARGLMWWSIVGHVQVGQGSNTPRQRPAMQWRVMRWVRATWYIRSYARPRSCCSTPASNPEDSFSVICISTAWALQEGLDERLESWVFLHCVSQSIPKQYAHLACESWRPTYLFFFMHVDWKATAAKI